MGMIFTSEQIQRLGGATLVRKRGTGWSIDVNATRSFWDERATKFNESFPEMSVLFSDQNPEDAKSKSIFEIEQIRPLLRLGTNVSVLDIGCGVGRWGEALEGRVKEYTGTDFSTELIQIAEQRFKNRVSFRFGVMDAVNTNYAQLNRKFDLIIIAGLLMYQNDDEVKTIIANTIDLANCNAQLLIREPFARKSRLTLRAEWSTALDASYSSIYRTELELADLISIADSGNRMNLVASGSPRPQDDNSDSETYQKFLLFDL